MLLTDHKRGIRKGPGRSLTRCQVRSFLASEILDVMKPVCLKQGTILNIHNQTTGCRSPARNTSLTVAPVLKTTLFLPGSTAQLFPTASQEERINIMGFRPWQAHFRALLSSTPVEHRAILARGEGSLLQRLAKTSKYGTDSSGSTCFNTEQYSLLINQPGK